MDKRERAIVGYLACLLSIIIYRGFKQGKAVAGMLLHYGRWIVAIGD